jgi:hypothetical protein
LVTMYHAGPCETVDPNQASYQKDVYDVWGYPEPRLMHLSRVLAIWTLQHITVLQYT